MWQLNDLASKVGCYIAPGEPIQIPVGKLIGMLILSTALNRGLELPYSSPLPSWFPGLRQGVLLNLGLEYSTWYAEGDTPERLRFFAKLAGHAETVRPQIAPYLYCSLHDAIRELRVYSANDTQPVKFGEHVQNRPGHLPLFTLDTDNLASKIRSECGGRLFTVRPNNSFALNSPEGLQAVQNYPYGSP